MMLFCTRIMTFIMRSKIMPEKPTILLSLWATAYYLLYSVGKMKMLGDLIQQNNWASF